MKIFKIYTLPQFEEDKHLLFTKFEQIEIENILSDLLIDGDKKGKPLGYNFFIEKKIQHKRIYYLIYDELNIILLVAGSNKKTQQKTITEIKMLLPKYKEYVYKFFI